MQTEYLVYSFSDKTSEKARINNTVGRKQTTVQKRLFAFTYNNLQYFFKVRRRDYCSNGLELGVDVAAAEEVVVPVGHGHVEGVTGPATNQFCDEDGEEVK